MKLLHVDRDQNFVHGFQNDLLRSGGMLCDLENAATLSEAREHLEKDRFDAVVIDPWSLDVELASEIRDLRVIAPTTPFVVLTSVNDDFRAIEAVATGASDYLIKEQSQPEWLMRRVRFAIERAKRNAKRHAVSQPHLARRWRATVASVLGKSVAEAAHHAGSVTTTRDHERADRGAGRPPIDDLMFRILHVEDDISYQRLVKKMLETSRIVKFRVDQVTRLDTATQMLQDEKFDLVMLDLSLTGISGLETLSTMLEESPDIPIVVMTGRDDDATAIQGMQLGAEDFLTKTETNLRFCPRAAQLAITRRRRITLEELPDESDAEAAPSAEPSNAKTKSERRQHSRYLLTRPIFAIPVMPDGSPAEAYSADGFSVDVSLGGMQFEIAGIDRLPTKQILVGIEAYDSVLHFASVEAKRVEPTGTGLRIGAAFTEGEHDLIRRGNIEPTFNPQTCRFGMDLPLEVIAKWIEFGILRATLMDRVLICPQCQAVPTFRNGCRICGSVRLHSRPLIHHFACAHIGYVSDFEKDGAIICPKCRTRNLIVGADYEHLSGPYRCLDCDWSDTDLELVGNCLKCEFRFPMNQALEEDLIGYHVHRLDALALINGD
ncbi:MAG TPA: response regulator [Pirellulaceae bacterium]|nr:response regulator [Planctomycetales bacterium]MCB9937281.1 response regulator [Planctomycetaceae bacterium]HRX78370.1 response regulator [Pirellulaceae bacterium]